MPGHGVEDCGDAHLGDTTDVLTTTVKAAAPSTTAAAVQKKPCSTSSDSDGAPDMQKVLALLLSEWMPPATAAQPKITLADFCVPNVTHEPQDSLSTETPSKNDDD